MSKLRVNAFSISLDGFGAGPNQSREDPLGAGGESLHEWIFPTRMFRTLYGNGDGETGPDNDFAERSFDNLGAWIMGRNMFGPVRGEWPDEAWRGWWGDSPPYHCDVFVLTHHPRPSFEMKGGTVFHFVAEGAAEALERARKAAGDKDVRIGGGAATIRQYLRAGAVDEMHVAVSPVLLGSGEPFWQGLDLPALGYEVAGSTAGERASHLRIVRKDIG